VPLYKKNFVRFFCDFNSRREKKKQRLNGMFTNEAFIEESAMDTSSLISISPVRSLSYVSSSSLRLGYST
jgi:hypothetical protein